MRLWSLHPKYLDAKGLTACWREGLLARKVLEGKTRGYRSHPQLERFRSASDPVAVIDSYLLAICAEAALRGYNFDRTKIGPRFSDAVLDVTKGQLLYELKHLHAKLESRDPKRLQAILDLKLPLAHPLFRVVDGGVEQWERV